MPSVSATFRIPAGGLSVRRVPGSPAAAGRRWRSAIRALLPEHGLLAALEIRHPLAAEPVRLVSAPRDHVLGGRNHTGLPFQWRLAADERDRAPRTQIVIPWAGREMADLLETAAGGVGAAVDISEWSFDPDNGEPPEPEWRLCFHVVAANVAPVPEGRDAAAGAPVLHALILDLGVTPRADRPGVSARYTPETDPWIFA